MNPEIQPGSLAEQLKRLRTGAGLTHVQLAVALGWGDAARPKVSKIEHGRQTPAEDEIRAWAQATGHPELTDELLDLLAEATATHRRYREGLRAGGAASLQQRRDEKTRAATRVRNADIMLLPGLLQTPEYAASIFRQATLLYGDTVDVDGAVAARMERQRVLYDPAKTFEFVTTEAVLHLLPCSQKVMLVQLDRLFMALTMPNVTFGIIPFGYAVPLVPHDSFELLDDHLSVETLAGTTDHDGGAMAGRYHAIFDLLMAEALVGDAARQVITSAAERLRST